MSTEQEKQKFLVVYDYGQGGVWAFVWATSAEQIRRQFRDIEVVDDWPSWLNGDELAELEKQMTFVADDLQPTDWITRLLRRGN